MNASVAIGAVGCAPAHAARTVGGMEFASIVFTLARWFTYALIARAVLSWFPTSTGAAATVARFVDAVTEPVLRPVRRVVPPLRIGGAGIDLAPLVVIVALNMVLPMLFAR